MGILLLVLLYAATAALLTLGTRWLSTLEDRGPQDPPAASAVASPVALVLLALLPVLFTAGGFLPGKVLAPTNTLVRVPPWLDSELVERVREGSTPENQILLDPLTQMLPWSRAAREDLLFNPAQASGAALLANGQSAVLFPTEALSRLLPPVAATTYRQAARLLLAAFGMFLLVRSLALSEAAGLVGAAVYLGSGFLQLWRLHPHSLVAAVLPWILWAALGLARRPGPGPALGLALAGALGVYAGHAETLLHGVILAGLLALPVLLRPREPGSSEGPDGRRGGLWRRRRWRVPWRKAARGVGWALGAALLAFLLAAPALLPFVENLTVSDEWQRRQPWDRPGGNASVEAPWPRALVQMAFAATPWAWGDPRLTGLDDPTPGPDNAPELAGGAVGSVALILVTAALLRRRRGDRSEDPGGPRAGRVPAPWLWLALGLVGALAAGQVPGVSGSLASLPLLSLSIVGRLSLWWVVAASVLGALGFERLRRRQPRSLLGAALGGLAVVLGLALVVRLLPSSLVWAGVPLEAVALLLGGVATVLLVASGGRRQGRPGRAAGGLRAGVSAAVLLALTLVGARLLVFHGWVPVASSLSYYPDTLGVRHVQRLQAEAPGVGYRVAGLGAALVPHSAVFFGLEEVRVYDPMVYAPYQRFLALLGERPAHGWIPVEEPASAALDFLGVRWIFDRPEMGLRPGLEPVYAGPDVLVHRNPRALPRVFVPAEAEIVPGPVAGAPAFEAVRRIAGEPGALRRRVVLQGPDLPPPGIHPNGDARVAQLRVEAGRLEAVVEAESVAVVATSQPAIPGWRLWRDGEEHRPLTVNGAFLGAAVEPGTSRLEWVYAPRSWDLGRGLSVLGLLLACGSGGLAWSRRRSGDATGAGGTR